MASDLKFEIFASRLLGSFWFEAGFLSKVPEILSLYPKEYNFDPENADIYEESYHTAIFVKHLFYYCILEDELRKLPTPFEPSPSYISDYISHTCRRDGVFGDLTVFELVFTSIVFVIHLFFHCNRKFGYNDLIRYAHLSWAMYFDEYKEEFYRQGGWSQLKIVSLSYNLPYEFLSPYPQEIFHSYEKRRDFILRVMIDIDNYKTFAGRIPTNCKTVSKAWVKYHLQNISKSQDSLTTIDASKRQDIVYPKAIENFLLHFRCFFDHNTSDVLRVKVLPNFIDSGTQYTEENPQSLNDIAANLQSDTEIKEREIRLPIQKNHNQINKLILADITRKKDTTSNTSENNSSQTYAFWKLKMTSRDNFPRIKTQITKEQELHEENKKEIDLERESSEVKCLLRMILVLGNPEGIIHVRSSLQHLDINKSTQKACSTITSLSIYGGALSRSLTQRRDFPEFFKSSCYTLPSTWEGSTIRNTCGDRDSLVVKVTSSLLALPEFEPSAAKDSPYEGTRFSLNLSRLKHPPVGFVWKLVEGDIFSGCYFVT
ncbi:uncharacterized protein TNCV_293171 [Trichonephila clavipes]|nr:uncharacterized protein TNCV_293171 [Trichonephila clavipes]